MTRTIQRPVPSGNPPTRSHFPVHQKHPSIRPPNCLSAHFISSPIVQCVTCQYRYSDRVTYAREPFQSEYWKKARIWRLWKWAFIETGGVNRSARYIGWLYCRCFEIERSCSLLNYFFSFHSSVSFKLEECHQYRFRLNVYSNVCEDHFVMEAVKWNRCRCLFPVRYSISNVNSINFWLLFAC